MFFENSTPLATQVAFDMDVVLVTLVSKDALELQLFLRKPRPRADRLFDDTEFNPERLLAEFLEFIPARLLDEYLAGRMIPETDWFVIEHRCLGLDSFLITALDPPAASRVRSPELARLLGRREASPDVPHPVLSRRLTRGSCNEASGSDTLLSMMCREVFFVPSWSFDFSDKSRNPSSLSPSENEALGMKDDVDCLSRLFSSESTIGISVSPSLSDLLLIGL
jgi:hypothetical protein